MDSQEILKRLLKESCRILNDFQEIIEGFLRDSQGDPKGFLRAIPKRFLKDS